MHFERLSSWISIAILMLLVGGTWWAAERARHSIEEDPLKRISHEPDYFVERFITVRSDTQGLPNSRLQGERLVHYPDDDSMDLAAPYSWNLRTDRPAVLVQAKAGRLDQDGARLQMHGDVYFYREGDAQRTPLQIRSNEMTLYPDDDVATTDSAVDIDTGRSRLLGTGFRYDNIQRQLTLAQQTRAYIAPPIGAAPPLSSGGFGSSAQSKAEKR